MKELKSERVKTIAIIGASYLQRPLVERAKEMGLRTICFAWEEGAVCKDLCDVFYPISITEKEQILRICRDEHIDGICTIGSDVDLDEPVALQMVVFCCRRTHHSSA